MYKKILSQFLDYSGIITIMRCLGNKNLVILNYHKISPISHDLMSDTWSATPKQFEQQMAYLKKHYNVLSLEKFSRCFEKTNFKKNSVLITFDDGEIENYQYVYPILKKYNLPAVFFITTDYVGSKELPWWDKVSLLLIKFKKKEFHLSRYGKFLTGNYKDKKETIKKIKHIIKRLPVEDRLKFILNLELVLDIRLNEKKRLFLSWDEIKEMHANGMAIEPHSVSHPVLSNETVERINIEIKNSKYIIEKKLSKKCISFCYPNGHLIDINENVKTALRKNRIKYAFTTVLGDNRLFSDKLQLKRICIAKGFSFSVFKAETAGIFSRIREYLWKQA